MLRRLRRQNESKDLVLPRWHIVIRKIVLVATEKTIAFGTNTSGSICNKSDCSPNLKDSRAALQARDLEQPGTLEGRPILVKRALPARLAQAFYAA